MFSALRRRWQDLPPRTRSTVTTCVKVVVTASAFYLLFTHEVRNERGEHVTALRAILDYIPRIEGGTFWTFVFVASFLKALGILASMYRWHLLLVGQGIRFPFRHLAGSFLIGRFIGTFLPSTIGLDGYKLYDAARFSGKTVEAGAATVVEKVVGLSGIFLTFLVTFPLGYDVLGRHAPLVATVTVPLALVVVGVLYFAILRPGLFRALVSRLPLPAAGKVRPLVERVTEAATAYHGRTGLVAAVAALSFFVHFFTAAMYYFTALAIGAAHANFWEVCFASSIQILATVLSPFTIAGEGVREIVQALLLARKLGVSESIISAALGFWAAEALTLVGGLVYLARPVDYRPSYVDLQSRSRARG
ncbi:MAG: hypothetical protein KatS3mg076_2792 [Candidatus Binatia bacterium]|nr:MAG: hypothetical protein KatS3mg076_2792 [Candidatus Binatia bacterium]